MIGWCLTHRRTEHGMALCGSAGSPQIKMVALTAAMKLYKPIIVVGGRFAC